MYTRAASCIVPHASQRPSTFFRPTSEADNGPAQNLIGMSLCSNVDRLIAACRFMYAGVHRRGEHCCELQTPCTTRAATHLWSCRVLLLTPDRQECTPSGKLVASTAVLHPGPSSHAGARGLCRQCGAARALLSCKPHIPACQTRSKFKSANAVRCTPRAIAINRNTIMA